MYSMIQSIVVSGSTGFSASVAPRPVWFSVAQKSGRAWDEANAYVLKNRKVKWFGWSRLVCTGKVQVKSML